eukprot:Rhum_TRINITY_DN8316_c1_g1::Rhum_TRINITY_DN8316_c1_g1_i1::g.27314::m.27314
MVPGGGGAGSAVCSACKRRARLLDLLVFLRDSKQVAAGPKLRGVVLALSTGLQQCLDLFMRHRPVRVNVDVVTSECVVVLDHEVEPDGGEVPLRVREHDALVVSKDLQVLAEELRQLGVVCLRVQVVHDVVAVVEAPPVVGRVDDVHRVAEVRGRLLRVDERVLPPVPGHHAAAHDEHRQDQHDEGRHRAGGEVVQRDEHPRALTHEEAGQQLVVATVEELKELRVDHHEAAVVLQPVDKGVADVRQGAGQVLEVVVVRVVHADVVHVVSLRRLPKDRPQDADEVVVQHRRQERLEHPAVADAVQLQHVRVHGREPHEEVESAEDDEVPEGVLHAPEDEGGEGEVRRRPHEDVAQDEGVARRVHQQEVGKRPEHCLLKGGGKQRGDGVAGGLVLLPHAVRVLGAQRVDDGVSAAALQLLAAGLHRHGHASPDAHDAFLSRAFCGPAFSASSPMKYRYCS